MDLRSNEMTSKEQLSLISQQASESEKVLLSLLQLGVEVVSGIVHSAHSVISVDDLFPTLDSMSIKIQEFRKPECDLFIIQLRKLCNSVKSLEEAFGELGETIGSEYDFVEYDLNKSTLQGLASSRLSDISDDSLTVVDGAKKEDIKFGADIGGAASSIDGIRTKILKLCKQYAFARQREIEKNMFEKKLDEVGPLHSNIYTSDITSA
jgi:hypothetical protein